MSIRSKIVLGFFGITLIMVAQIFYLIYNLKVIEAINRSLTGIDFNVLDLEKQLFPILQDQYSLDEKYMVRYDKDYLPVIRSFETDFRTRLASINPLLQTPAEKTFFARLNQLYTEYTNTFLPPRDLMALDKRGTKEDFRGKKFSLNTRLSEDLKKLIDASTLNIQNKIALVSKTNQKAEKITITVSVSAILLSLLLVFLIVRRLNLPLQRLELGTQHLARGDFHYRIKPKGHDELASLSRAFNLMASRLGELDRMKKEFLSHVSHELKGPLAAIKEVNGLLLGGVMGGINEKQLKLLKISRQNCERLAIMLADLLDLSKIEAGVMEYRMTEEDLGDLVVNTIREIEPVSFEKNLKINALVPEENITLPLDKNRISQVLTNLLSNAIKFTPEGGTINVKVERVTDPNGMVPERYRHAQSKNNGLVRNSILVSVEDTGIGIPNKDLEQIFEKFYQVKENTKMNIQGTGLGLAIARNIVEAHGGFIWAESSNGKGSRFNFVLPTEKFGTQAKS